MPQKQILTTGAQHAATTTFSRLLCDVDPRCLFIFEPDHIMSPERVTVDNLLALLRCDLNSSMFSSWAELPDMWKDGGQCHDRRGDYHSHCSSSFEHCNSPSECSALQRQCELSPVVGLKTINRVGRLGQDLERLNAQAGGLAASLAVVHLVRDARGWMAPFIRRQFNDAWDEAQTSLERDGAASGALALSGGHNSPETATQMLAYIRETAGRFCPRIAADELAAAAQLQRPPGPGDAKGEGGAVPFLHVNMDAFASLSSQFKTAHPEYNHVAEVRLADYVRGLLGFQERIGYLEGQRFETPKLNTADGIGDLMRTKNRNANLWRWVYYWVPNYDEVITEICGEVNLFSKRPWAVQTNIPTPSTETRPVSSQTALSEAPADALSTSTPSPSALGSSSPSLRDAASPQVAHKQSRSLPLSPPHPQPPLSLLQPPQPLPLLPSPPSQPSQPSLVTPRETAPPTLQLTQQLPETPRPLETQNGTPGSASGTVSTAHLAGQLTAGLSAPMAAAIGNKAAVMLIGSSAAAAIGNTNATQMLSAAQKSIETTVDGLGDSFTALMPIGLVFALVALVLCLRASTAALGDLLRYRLHDKLSPTASGAPSVTMGELPSLERLRVLQMSSRRGVRAVRSEAGSRVGVGPWKGLNLSPCRAARPERSSPVKKEYSHECDGWEDSSVISASSRCPLTPVRRRDESDGWEGGSAISDADDAGHLELGRQASQEGA